MFPTLLDQQFSTVDVCILKKLKKAFKTLFPSYMPDQLIRILKVKPVPLYFSKLPRYS